MKHSKALAYCLENNCIKYFYADPKPHIKSLIEIISDLELDTLVLSGDTDNPDLIHRDLNNLKLYVGDVDVNMVEEINDRLIDHGYSVSVIRQQILSTSNLFYSNRLKAYMFANGFVISDKNHCWRKLAKQYTKGL